MSEMTQNNSKDLDQSTTYLKKIMQDVLNRALNSGATDAAVAIHNDQGFSIEVRKSEVETVSFGEDKSIALTTYFGHQKGSASSTDTSTQALDSLVKSAVDIAKLSAEDKCFGLADKELLTNDFKDCKLYYDWEIRPEDAIEKAIACESYAMELDKRIVNSDGVSVSASTSHYGYANTRGAQGLIHSTNHGMSCSFIAKEKDEMQRDYDYTAARDIKLLMPEKIVAKNAVERSLARLGARKIKTQKAPVVFSSRVSNTLLSSFIAAISGSNLYRKNSFLVDSLDFDLFPEFINIYEQPHTPGGLGSTPFDTEGVPTRANSFVQQGKLKQYALGSYSARRLGLQATANADGVHNLTVDANAEDLEDVLKTMGTGLLVTELMGQGVNLLTGDYSRGASGFWVENGVIKYAVEEITIAGNLKQMFKDILIIGKDINPNIATKCGSILLKEMMIAGS